MNPHTLHLLLGLAFAVGAVSIASNLLLAVLLGRLRRRIEDLERQS